MRYTLTDLKWDMILAESNNTIMSYFNDGIIVRTKYGYIGAFQEEHDKSPSGIYVALLRLPSTTFIVDNYADLVDDYLQNSSTKIDIEMIKVVDRRFAGTEWSSKIKF